MTPPRPARSAVEPRTGRGACPDNPRTATGPLRAEPAAGGDWWAFDPPSGATTMRVRAARDSDGRWQITALHITGTALTPDTMRGISLARIEAQLALGRPTRDIPRTRLRRPDRADLEGFYRRVAVAYREYAAETHAPAQAMAAEAGVPVTTVHRWIRESRRRGALPPARQGRAG